MTNETALIRSYSGLTRILSPFLPLWVKGRALKGKENPDRQQERFGHATLDRPEGYVLWLHGASVGETTMLLPLIKRFLKAYPDAHILITSGTVTSAEVLNKRLPNRALHQYVPLDTPGAVKKFLRHWKPNMAIWSESEIWPNLLKYTKARKIPMALVNARMSNKSLEGWSSRKKSARALFGKFDKILAGNEDTANGLTWLLGQEINFVGNLKDAAPALPFREDEYKDMTAQLGQRPIWCAASTHEGEEELLLKAHMDVLQSHGNALLILAPRHPERSKKIRNLMENVGITYAARSEATPLTDTHTVYLYDTIGEMGLAYQLSSVTFVGGSLLKDMSGHNPLEPARLDNAVLTGAYISSFADTYISMFAFSAAERLFSANQVGPRVSELLSNSEIRHTLMSHAKNFAAGRDAILDYVWAELTPLMEKSGLSTSEES